MTKIKKTLCLLLSLIFVLAVIPMSASASTNGHTAQDAIAWVKSQLGKSLDYDGVYGAQCVDLIKYYYDYLGCASYARGNGCDYAYNALPPGWARYQGAQPQLGDILVYSGSNSNPYGHVAIYESDYVTYHQNYNYCNYVVQVNRKYNSSTNPYWGVIRPDFSGAAASASWEGPTVSQLTETDAHLDGKVIYNSKLHTSQLGVRIYDSNNTLIAYKDEYVNYNYSYVTIWYDITGELGCTLTPGKTYYVRFYAIGNGKEYWSPTVNFTTPHTHNYTSKITTDPTCISTGVMTYTCTVCGEEKTQAIEETAHKNTTVTKRATVKKNGSVVQKCAVCGEVFKTVAIAKIKTVKLSKTKLTYTGKTLKPSVTVKDSKGNTLKLGTDYTVKYKNNKNYGKATVTVTFKGKYRGSVTLSFSILPATPTGVKAVAGKKQAKISWNSVAGADSYTVLYSTNKKSGFEKLTVTKTSATVKRLSSKKTYYFKVVANDKVGKKTYSSASSRLVSAKIK